LDVCPTILLVLVEMASVLALAFLILGNGTSVTDNTSPPLRTPLASVPTVAPPPSPSPDPMVLLQAPPSRPLPQPRSKAPTQSDPCKTLQLPKPKVSFLYHERKNQESDVSVYYLSIDNYLDYPSVLFSAAPPEELVAARSCHGSEETAYTWIDIVNAETGKVVVQHCTPLENTPDKVSFEATSFFPVYVQFRCGYEGVTPHGASNTIDMLPNALTTS